MNSVFLSDRPVYRPKNQVPVRHPGGDVVNDLKIAVSNSVRDCFSTSRGCWCRVFH
ncbi:hypothetical protein EMIT0P100_30125 [Pseudomonas sp. IT-P100]